MRRDNLFRSVKASFSTSNLFSFLQDQRGHFLRSVIQTRLGGISPDFCVSTHVDGSRGAHRFPKQAADSFRFLYARFSLEYLYRRTQTFVLKLRSATLPATTRMEQNGVFVRWGANCLLRKCPETIEHVPIDYQDAILFANVLGRTLIKYLHVTSYGIR